MKEANWDRFFHWLPSTGLWAQTLELTANIHSTFPHLSEPYADAGEEGPSLTWVRKGLCVQVEVIGPEEFEWFVASHEMDGYSCMYTTCDPLDLDEVRPWLQKAIELQKGDATCS